MRWAWHLSCSLFHLGGGRGVALILLPSPLGVSFYSRVSPALTHHASCPHPMTQCRDRTRGALPSYRTRQECSVLLPWVQKLQTRPDRGRMHYCISRPPPHSSLRLVGRDAEEEDTSCLCWFHTNLGSLGHGLETWTLECPFNIKFPKKCSVSLVQWHGTDMHRIDIQVHVIVLKAASNLKHIGKHLKHHQASYANIHNYKLGFGGVPNIFHGICLLSFELRPSARKGMRGGSFQGSGTLT